MLKCAAPDREMASISKFCVPSFINVWGSLQRILQGVSKGDAFFMPVRSSFRIFPLNRRNVSLVEASVISI